LQNNVLLVLAVVLPLAGAVFAYFGGRKRTRIALWSMLGTAAAVLAILTVLLVQSARGGAASYTNLNLCVLGLSLYADGFRALYAWIAALLWTIAAVFSFSYFQNGKNIPRYAFFTLITLSSAIGVFLSDQLLTTIMFFEVMSLTSYPWVAHDETPEAMRAAQSYLWIAIIGGMCMLMGMLLLPQSVITARYSAGIATEGIDSAKLMLPCILILIGFGAKAGAFPLHVWLPKAYPVAPAPATALLSAVLSKAGVFGILILSVKLMGEVTAWHALIFWIGVITMVLGGLLALMAVNIKRILAGSSMSQIGFILLGVGLYGLLSHHGGIAAQGLVQHMVNHSLFKMILFLCAGVVVMNLHQVNLDDVRGFGHGKPLLHFVFLSGMLGLAGVPLCSGFASKSLLHESLLEYIALQPDGAWMYTGAEWLFLLSGGLTLAYMLKLYICLFWEKPALQAIKTPYLSRASAVMLGGMAAAVWVFGLFPSVFLGGIANLSAGFMQAELPAVRYFSTENLLGAAKSIGIGILVYILIVRGLLSKKTEDGRLYPNYKPAWLDLETLVYVPLLKAVLAVIAAFSWAVAALPDAVISGIRRALLHVRAWRVPMPGGNRFTCAVGESLNSFVAFLNKTALKNHPTTIDFSCALAAGNQEFRRSIRRLKRSVSYTLLLFCIGLFAVLSYLLFWVPG